MTGIAGQTAKRELRRRLLAQRRSLTRQSVIKFSEQIFRELTQLAEFKKANVIMCYAALEDEVQTEKIIEYALQAGKRVCIPHIRDKAGIMDAVCIHDEADLIAGDFGILTVAAAKGEVVSPEQIEFIVVPGVAFDRTGHRLGFGAGFYDRFLAQAKNAFRLGLAFSCQMAEDVPSEPHDYLMHAVLTEQALSVCRDKR